MALPIASTKGFGVRLADDLHTDRQTVMQPGWHRKRTQAKVVDRPRQVAGIGDVSSIESMGGAGTATVGSRIAS